ncbi:MAG: MFS transporter [Meiothermus sp.]|uniref:MFS transporter n=1 Tax=Meiothermus sp. TaxID=1955249 RepID=UPI00298EDEE9|nr:MFS transporter [Meiothermus sp.]MDW8425113.1 MFS transporter [Meiothermus sp.]
MQRKPLTAITAAHISVDMQTGSLAVLLPFLLTSFNLNYAAAAAIITANNIVIAIAQPLFGTLGDRKSFKWMVWVGCLLTGVMMVTVLWWPGYWLVVAAVLLSGLGSAMFHPEALSRVRAVSGQQAASGTSFFFSGGNIGFALGPIVATLLIEQWGRLGGLLMLVPTAVGLWLLGSQWKLISQDSAKKARPTGQAGKIAIGLVVFLIGLITLRSTIQGGLQTFIPLYFQSLGDSKEHAAFLVTIVAIFGAVGTLTGGVLADRYGRKRVMGLSALASLGLLYGFLHTSGLLQMVFLAAAGVCISMAWPVIVVMIQEAMPGHVGLASGLSLGTSYGATGLGVAALGNFADGFGLVATMTLITLLPILVVLMTLFVPERTGNMQAS